MVNNPNIRFAGFSDEWVQRKLGDLARVQGGNAWSSSDYVEKGQYLVITISNVTGNEYVNDSSGNYIDCINPGVYELFENDILVSLTGNVGRVSKMTKARAVLNQRVARVLTCDSFDNEFLFQVLSNSEFESRMINVGQGAAQMNISNRDVIDYDIKIPTLKEQQKIGSIFSTLDHKIGLEERQISLLKDLKKGYLQKMFPKNGVTEPEIRFVWFADDWKERKLGDIADVKDGKDHGKLSHGDIPMYGTGGYMYGVNKSLSDVDAIGIGHRGTIGNPHILKSPFWAIGTLYYAVPHDAIDIKYLMYNLSRVEWRRYNETIAVPTIPKDRVKSTSVNLPSYHEQQKISGLLNVIDEMIDSYSDEISKLEQIKKGLLQQMFV